MHLSDYQFQQAAVDSTVDRHYEDRFGSMDQDMRPAPPGDETI
jgi:hypothetical protein